MSSIKKATHLLLAVFFLHAVLVATHQGEFWPFSIYPMFSEAGRVWERAIVRQVPADMPDSLLWRTTSFDSLPGEAFPVEAHGIPQNDLSDYLAKKETDDSSRLAGLRTFFSEYFDEAPDTSRLLILTARGPDLSEVTTDSVPIRVMPRYAINSDTLQHNPIQ